MKDIKPDIYLRDYSIREFDEMIKSFPTDVWLFYGRALEYFFVGRTDLAFRDFGEAITLNPEYAKA